jgi:hypothetical protein
MCIALDVDGILVSDTKDYSYDPVLNDAISSRLNPIFVPPHSLPYVLITSRQSRELTEKTLLPLLGSHQPLKMFHEYNPSVHSSRAYYKYLVMESNPEITTFFESEQETISEMIRLGIDPNRLCLWKDFIQESLMRARMEWKPKEKILTIGFVTTSNKRFKEWVASKVYKYGSPHKFIPIITNDHIKGRTFDIIEADDVYDPVVLCEALQSSFSR